MYSLYANVLNETEKLWARRRTKGFLLLTILVPALSAFVLAMFQSNTDIFGGIGSNFPLLMLSLFTFAIVPLFLFMSAADAFAGELAAGTLKLVLTRPIARTTVFASKVLAIVFYIAVFLGALWTASLISGLFLSGMDIAEGFHDSVIAYTVAILPMMAIGLIAILIVQCIRNSTGAMALIIFLYVAAKFLPFIFPQLSVWSVFSYTNWHELWLGNGAAFGILFNKFVLLLSYCIMAYAAGLILFDRKQL